jgi:hypothetical protein
LKNIKAYYTEANKLYVLKEAYMLNQNGIEVELVDASKLPKTILTPAFAIFKQGGVLSKLEGKHTPGIVLEWVKKYMKGTK